jgi:hypothetical protein
MMKLIIREYLSADGRSFFREELDTLDISVRARIQARVLRFETGNLVDHTALAETYGKHALCLARDIGFISARRAVP